jgi:hypothetical protein
MRSYLIASVLFVAVGVSAAPNSPFLRLEHTSKAGKVLFTVKNISHQPIVAYVVVAERPNHRSVWHGVYTGRDSLPVGDTVTVGEAPVGPAGDKFNASVDYVRLADGTSWGEITTDDAKEIAARFQH